jgi:PAS domain S-box-containing protein
LEATLNAIGRGDIDAVVLYDHAGNPQLFTLRGADTPYQLLVEQMREGALTVNAEGTILYANRRFAEMLGVALESVIGAQIDVFVAPMDAARLRRSCAACQLEDGGARLEISLRPPSGIALPAHVSINGLTETDHVCIVVTDLTEQKAGEERQQMLLAERVARSEAERSSLLKDEFVATISHELRTPLNAILGWSQVLLRGRLKTEDFDQGLQAIERNARAQAQLIEDLLDMSRITSGKLRLEMKIVSFRAIVEAAVSSVLPATEAKGITIQLDLEVSGDTVRGDPNRLQQVVWNLLSNAVKFTPKGGRIEVALERSGSDLQLRVGDTGVGIAREFLPNVFERFRQADGSTTRQFGGLGLGLSIVKQLVELHGGSVRAKSAGEGQGSSFVVTIPVNLRHPGDTLTDAEFIPERTATPPPAKLDGKALAGLTIVYVDDDSDARELVRRILLEQGASVFVGVSAPEALILIAREHPHVLLADISMPGQDGYSLIRTVRALKDEDLRVIPAVAVTALARPEDRRRTLLAGYQTHVAKPVEPNELVAVVARLAGRLGDAN